MAFLDKEKLTKIGLEVGVMALAGMVCVVGSYLIVNKVLAPMTHPAAASALPPEGAEPKSPKEEKKPEEKARPPKKHGEGKHGESEGQPGESGVYAMKPIVVNLAQDSDHRFAKVTVTLELENSKDADLLRNSEANIYDALIRVLGRTRAQNVASDEGKELVKEQIKTDINEALAKEVVSRVFLTEFLVQ